MEKRRLRKLVGMAMVALGLIQVGSFAVAGDWLFSFFGLLYAIIGVAYLRAEVFSPVQ